MARTRKPRPVPPPPAPQLRCIYELLPSDGWRWFASTGAWERICEAHNTLAVQRRGDYVADDAPVQRAEVPQP